MPLPTLAPPATPRAPATTLNRTQAAARLGLNGPGVDKMVRAGMLGLPIGAGEVERLMRREFLSVAAGELTVLRTDARAVSDRTKYPHEDRRWVGFHVEHSDDELAASSLRWWRCDPDRLLSNEIFTVSVSSFPVAVYRLLEVAASIVRPDESMPRHAFRGQLLARAYPGMEVKIAQNTPGHLREMAKQIMDSRVVVTSGGPIGYLEPKMGPDEVDA